MFTTSAMRLFENGNVTDLLSHGSATTSESEGEFRIDVWFKVNRNGETKIYLRFPFKIANGYWSLTSVVVGSEPNTKTLDLIGKPLTAPLGFSYKCAQTIVFKNSSVPMNLTLQDVQVVLPMLFLVSLL